MKNLKKKLSKNGGFTLVEMLIVVAIIAILIAVSIPTLSNSLDKAREASDDANLRSAKAVALINYMTVDDISSIATAYGGGGQYRAFYSVEDSEGKLVQEIPNPGYGQSAAHKNDYIVILFKTQATDADQEVVVKWSRDP